MPFDIMGNGASSKKCLIIDGEKMTLSQLKQNYPKLLDDLDAKNALLEEKEKVIEEQKLEISQLQKEIRQLRCVVDTKATANSNVPATIPENEEASKLALSKKFKDLELQNFSRMDSKTKFLAVAVNAVRNKRFAVSAESGDRKSATKLQELKKHPKDSS